MSYCRFGWDKSHVYVFHSVDGPLTCCGCSLPKKLKKGKSYDKWGDFWTEKYSEMFEHLEAHRKAGQNVPDYALDRLRHEGRLFDDNATKLDYDHPDLGKY